MARKRGKKYQEAAKLVDRARAYPPEEGVQLVKQTSPTAFDATVEAHVRLGIDPRQNDQQLRSTVVLPHGTGRSVRVVVFAQGENAREAEEAGADRVGGEDLAAAIQGGWLEFDVAVATPDVMRFVTPLGRVLGPRGLMPNARTGTVTQDIARTIREIKAGRVEFRTERNVGQIHVPIGKVSFDEARLMENLRALMSAVVAARPSGAKGQYLRGVTLSSTMGPGITLDLPAATALAG